MMERITGFRDASWVDTMLTSAHDFHIGQLALKRDKQEHYSIDTRGNRERNHIMKELAREGKSDDYQKLNDELHNFEI